MEEEYRNEKTAAEQQEKEKTASTTALRGTSPPPTPTHDGSVNGDEDDDKKSLSGEDEAAAESTTDCAPTIEKPEQTVGAEEVMSGSEDPQAPAESSTKKYTHFQNKRLCERWLDNLFMLLYEVCPHQTSTIFIWSLCLWNFRICGSTQFGGQTWPSLSKNPSFIVGAHQSWRFWVNWLKGYITRYSPFRE